MQIETKVPYENVGTFAEMEKVAEFMRTRMGLAVAMECDADHYIVRIRISDAVKEDFKLEDILESI